MADLGLDWDAVGSARFEQIVSVLLSTLHPDSERIDGSGGDGGRDHQLRSDGRLDLWQSKYFVRRLSEAGGRKAQITSSLNTAAGLQPDSWSLVTPMCPTPEELKWFDALKEDSPFPLVWRDGAWLAARLAEHPSIVRHFTGPNDAYVALLKELRQEQDAAVDGLPAGRARMEALAAKINDANPFYAVDLGFREGRLVTTSLRPKYRGAERDSPIGGRFDIVVESHEEQGLVESIREAFEWGEPVTIAADYVRDLVIDAPHGLGGHFERATVMLGPVEPEPIDLTLRLVVRAQGGRQEAALPIRLSMRTRAPRGLTLEGEDSSGVVAARVRLDTEESRLSLQLTFNEVPALLPGAVLPALRFMQRAIAPSTLEFGVGTSSPDGAIPLPAGPLVSAEAVALVEDLERVQAASGEAFPVPTEWTLDDQREVRRAARLVAGGRVRVGQGPLTLTVDDVKAAHQRMAARPLFALVLVPKENYIAHIAGHDLDLGPFTLYVQRARVSDLDDPHAPEGPGEVRVVTEDESGFEIALGALTHQPAAAAD